MATVASLSHQLRAPLSARGRARPARVARVAIRTRASTGDEAPMEVPEDAFKDENGHNVTPERKAAVALQNLFTMAATRVILDQFTGTRHRSPVYNKMVDFLSENPLRNGNEWLAKLMRAEDHDLRVTAMRIIETRRVFAESEFNWEICERVAREETSEDTLQMTKDFLTRGLSASAEKPAQARNENSW